MLRRLVLRFVLSAVAIFLCSGALSAISLLIDQSAPPAPDPIPFTFAIGGPHHQVLSQTVTAGESGLLLAVRVPLGCADGRLALSIFDVDPVTGQPGNVRLGGRMFFLRDFAGEVTDTYQTLPLLIPVRFDAGDQFAIVLSTTGSCGVWPGPVGNPYGQGTAWADADDGPIVPVSLGTDRDDLPFQTVMLVR